MKTKTFKSFLSDYAKEMNPNNTLSLFKTESLVENNTRLLTVFTFYVFFNEKSSSYLELKKDKLPNLYHSYRQYSRKYKGFNSENLKEKVSMLDNFDELYQLYNSYNNLVVNKNDNLKKVYHKKIKSLQKEKNISNYKIYTRLNLNQGNTNDYLKNQNLDKLSLESIKRVVDFVISV